MQLQNAYQNYLQNIAELKHYNEIAIPNAQVIVQTSKLGFESGEIGYIEYLHALKWDPEAQLNLFGCHSSTESISSQHQFPNQSIKSMETIHNYNKSSILLQLLQQR
ncbi:MAG: hypothetical protein R2852_06195 [Bacteroidia bacterium]